jgi:hypothetical protein
MSTKVRPAPVDPPRTEKSNMDEPQEEFISSSPSEPVERKSLVGRCPAEKSHRNEAEKLPPASN